LLRGCGEGWSTCRHFWTVASPKPLRQATVKAKVSGDVRQVPVREGESVRSGQLLARIDTADLEAKLIERSGALESAKAQLAMASKTQATNQQLLKQNFISQQAYDDRVSGSRETAANMKVAEATVANARLNLDYTKVRSPVAGRVSRAAARPRSGRR
jgi:RND family efflux transporter MFP subunit